MVVQTGHGVVDIFVAARRIPTAETANSNIVNESGEVGSNG